MKRKQLIRIIHLFSILVMALLISGCSIGQSGSEPNSAKRISERNRSKRLVKTDDSSNQSTKQSNKHSNKQSKEGLSSGTSNKLWGNSSNTDLRSNSSNTEAWADSDETKQWAGSDETEQWADSSNTDLWTDTDNTELWADIGKTESWSDSIDTESWTAPEKTELWSDSINTDLWGNSNNTSNKDTTPRNKEASTKDIEKLYGIWNIWIPGGAVNWYDIDTGEYVTHDYQPGAGAGIIKIHKNGTYSMSHDIWADSEIIEGKWRMTEAGEINGEETLGIVLIKGIDNIDWAVVPSSNNKIRLLYESEMTDGSSLWLFDSELYQ